MPLIHIHVTEARRTPAQLKRLADTVQQVMREYFAAPDRDRYQIITEHKPGQIIAEDTGLGFQRTDDIVILQIFQQGRTRDHKQAAYRALAEYLQKQTGLKPSDLIVSVVETAREDWSCGDGVAQLLEGLW
jgi:phenylpyruvate tautomerase PptA (4-oxalocrotonate tautomerase family)